MSSRCATTYQAFRLWDLREMRSNAEYDPVASADCGIHQFDYR